MNITVTLTEKVCPDCFIHYAMDAELNGRRLRDGGNFYCPNGHSLHYIETEVDRLKKENQNLQNRTKWAEQEADAAKREKTAIKGQLTKTRNRIANGVCPCCHRTFKQLAAHMDNKHPDFKKAVGEA